MAGKKSDTARAIDLLNSEIDALVTARQKLEAVIAAKPKRAARKKQSADVADFPATAQK